MRITLIEYDPDRGVVEVHLELPARGPLSDAEARRYLSKLIMDAFPPIQMVGKTKEEEAEKE
jgi:hypothetical protein